MLYIVTYVTHEERYFSILKNFPDLIVLGMGKKWNGLTDKVYGVLDFCKTKNSDDIVLFVDGFDSIILADSTEILDKYSKFKDKLVFSNSMKPKNNLYKYLQDKFFGRCRNLSLNSGMYIGTVNLIIDFWTNIIPKNDDQRYANSECNKKEYVEIDTTNVLFYNYSSSDKISISNNRIVLHENKPCVISAPASNNINHLLSKLGFTDLPKIDSNLKYKFKTYLKEFIPEILFVILSILIIKFNKTKIKSWIFIFLLFLELLHYELYVKFHDKPPFIKFIYCLMDIIHIGVMLLIFLLVINYKSDIKTLIFINILVFAFVTSFFIFKRCILTILENKVLGVDDSIGTVSRDTRLFYLFDINRVYKPSETKNNTIDWINSNTIIFILVLILNCLFFVKLIGKNN